MTTMLRLLCYLTIISLVLLCVPVSGIATQSPINVLSFNVTLRGTGCSSDCWFEFGQTHNGPYPLRTDNITAVGAFTYVLQNNPVVSNRTYYYRAADVDGTYGVESSFNLPMPTAFPTERMGAAIQNVTKNRMNLTELPLAVTTPYTDLITAPIVWFMVFFFIYSGLWMAHRDVSLLVILGLITASPILYAGPQSLGIPPEFIGPIQGVLYASAAGILFVLIKR